jgi:adenylate kinase
MMPDNRYVMLGIMGAGKGTQAKKLAGFLEIVHISTGDIFRDAVEKKTELGLKAREIMNEGRLVPDEVVVQIVKERVEEPDTGSGFILDGFPRTLNQAEKFNTCGNIDKVFYITIDEDEVLKRLMGRRVCESCNKDYNVYLEDVPEQCAECSGDIIIREDDNEATIRKRIANYFENTKPLVDYYGGKDILIEIDGMKDVNAVFESIKAFV